MRRLLLLLCLCLPVLAVQAQDRLTPELIWKLYKVSDPQVSPDGKTVVYRAGTADIKANRNLGSLYTMPVTGGTPTQVTKLDENAYGARWRPDGKKIGFEKVVDGEPQLFEADPDGKNQQQVTHIKGGVDNFLYSPDGKHLLFTQDVQVEPTLQQMFPGIPLDKCNARVIDALNYRHWDSWTDGAYTHVFYIDYTNGSVSGNPKDIMPGEPYDAPVKPFGGNEQLAWTPDGKQILYTSKKLKGTQYAVSTNSDLYLYNLEKGNTVDITEGNEGYDNDPTFSPDGKKLVYHSMQHPGYESDKNRLMLYDMATGQKTDLTADFDQNVDQVSWAPDSKTLYFVSGKQATVQLYAYTFKVKKGESNIRQITDGWHDYIAVQPAMNGKTPMLIATMMDYYTPPTLFSVDPKTGASTQLSQHNQDMLKNIKKGKVEQRWIPTTDGKQELTWVLFPPDFDSTRKYPTLLYCQGGPQSTVDQFFSVRWNLALMAAKGYIIVAPNRRGLPSFGQTWNDAIVGDYGGQPMQDLLSAIDKVSQEKYVDKAHLGAIGASFGGYSIYWLAGNHQNRFKCFIAHDGMFDMVSWYGTTEEMFFANHDQQGPYWQNPSTYQKFSPINFVKNWNTPILIIHSEKDFRVPIGQGMEAFNAAQIKGIPSRFLYFPDENHWVLKPQNGLLWQAVFFDWLQRYLTVQ